MSDCWRACALAQGNKRGAYIELSVPVSFLKEINMPIIAWLLGVPISVILLLMLFGVF
jgi:hypothetical protein